MSYGDAPRQLTDRHSLAGADDQRSNHKHRRGPGPVQCFVGQRPSSALNVPTIEASSGPRKRGSYCSADSGVVVTSDNLTGTAHGFCH